ncbi:MAG: AbgT family transporter [Acidobacteria bacterium]|nr:AbgT family transporter [Acidobacteriota bacterium]
MRASAETAPGSSQTTAAAPFKIPHAVVMMLLIIVVTVGLTYVIPSGAFDRDKGGLVRPGTYHVISKDYAPGDILAAKKSSTTLAYPASPLAVFTSIPVGMTGAASLIFMIMFIGGMFGVLQETGALNAGIERLLAATKGNVYVLAPLLMLAIAAGGTCLGLISEYLVLIPIMLVLAKRLGLDALFGTALITIAAKIGYMTSVTNPMALVIAQPIVGVEVFSGIWFRLITFVLYLPIGIWFLLRYVRKSGFVHNQHLEFSSAPLPGRHAAIWSVVTLSVVAIVVGAQKLDWENRELAAMYIFMAVAIAMVGRLTSRSAAGAFLTGMKAMVLPALLVGLAKSVEVILKDGLILDSVIHSMARLAEGQPPVIVAQAMVFIQMVIDVFIPSTSGKAAVTMPILGPIGQLAGVSGQVCVQAFIFGNGLTNTITPTSGMLLAYLATGNVSYGQWLKFILPLFLLLTVLSLAAISIAVLIGY